MTGLAMLEMSAWGGCTRPELGPRFGAGMVWMAPSLTTGGTKCVGCATGDGLKCFCGVGLTGREWCCGGGPNL